MLTDRTECVTTDKALEELDNRWFAAEAQASRNGQQYSWLWNEKLIDDAWKVYWAHVNFIEQFGPWMQRRLADVFWIATKNQIPTR